MFCKALVAATDMTRDEKSDKLCATLHNLYVVEGLKTDPDSAIRGQLSNLQRMLVDVLRVAGLFSPEGPKTFEPGLQLMHIRDNEKSTSYCKLDFREHHI